MLEASRVNRVNKIGAMLCCDKTGKKSGVLSERDIIIQIPRSGAEVLDNKISSCMTTGVYTYKEDDTIRQVVEVMTSLVFVTFLWWEKAMKLSAWSRLVTWFVKEYQKQKPMP